MPDGYDLIEQQATRRFGEPSRRLPSMNNTAAVPDREPLAGLVERVTYHNPDNGYCVLRVRFAGTATS